MSQETTKKSKRPYHHGDLRQALIDEAEKVIEQDGIQNLSLRALARAVGVTHTAPQNHFGDLTGLLSELAADGYRRLGEALAEATTDISDPKSKLRAMGKAYVKFARSRPGLFTLMFRSERLDSTRPALSDAINSLRKALQGAIAGRKEADGEEASPMVRLMRGTASWAMVHGYATLLIEGRLKGMLGAVPDLDEERFFDGVLAAVRFD